MIETGFLHLHLGCGLADLKFAYEPAVGRVVCVVALDCFGLEGLEVCAVSGLLSTVDISQGELLAAFEYDVLLEHAVADLLALDAKVVTAPFVDTLGHGENAGDLGLAGGFTDYVEAVLGDVIEGFGLLFFRVAGCNGDSHCSYAEKPKEFFHNVKLIK